MGDPIEVGAALAVLMAKRQGEDRTSTRAVLSVWPVSQLLASAALRHCPAAGADGPLALSAAKSAAGHAEPAAGLLGLACAALALESRALPRMLHLRCGRQADTVACASTHWAVPAQCLRALPPANLRPSGCRAVNPYVQQCLGSAGQASGGAAVSAPREAAPLAATTQAGRLATSISAFAFQVGA